MRLFHEKCLGCRIIIFERGRRISTNNGLVSGVLTTFEMLVFPAAAVMILSRAFGMDGIWHSLNASWILSVLLGVVVLYGLKGRYPFLRGCSGNPESRLLSIRNVDYFPADLHKEGFKRELFFFASGIKLKYFDDYRNYIKEEMDVQSQIPLANTKYERYGIGSVRTKSDIKLRFIEEKK